MSERILSFSIRDAAGKVVPEYAAWSMMKYRCHNQKSKQYRNYGARGISVCPEWRTSYCAFLAHVGHRPSPKHSIDRIDNDGDYAAGNVRWSTVQEQARNKRAFGASGVKGVYPDNYGNWVAQITLNKKNIRVGAFATIEEAAEARRKAELKYW